MEYSGKCKKECCQVPCDETCECDILIVRKEPCEEPCEDCFDEKAEVIKPEVISCCEELPLNMSCTLGISYSVVDETVVINIQNAKGNVQYSNNGISWQSSPIFSNVKLSRNFYAKDDACTVGVSVIIGNAITTTPTSETPTTPTSNTPTSETPTSATPTSNTPTSATPTSSTPTSATPTVPLCRNYSFANNSNNDVTISYHNCTFLQQATIPANGCIQVTARPGEWVLPDYVIPTINGTCNQQPECTACDGGILTLGSPTGNVGSQVNINLSGVSGDAPIVNYWRVLDPNGNNVTTSGNPGSNISFIPSSPGIYSISVRSYNCGNIATSFDSGNYCEMSTTSIMVYGDPITPTPTSNTPTSATPTSATPTSNTPTSETPTETSATPTSNTPLQVWNLTLCDGGGNASFQVDDINLNTGVVIKRISTGICYTVANQGAQVYALIPSNDYYETGPCNVGDCAPGTTPTPTSATPTSATPTSATPTPCEIPLSVSISGQANPTELVQYTYTANGVGGNDDTWIYQWGTTVVDGNLDDPNNTSSNTMRITFPVIGGGGPNGTVFCQVYCNGNPVDYEQGTLNVTVQATPVTPTSATPTSATPTSATPTSNTPTPCEYWNISNQTGSNITIDYTCCNLSAVNGLVIPSGGQPTLICIPNDGVTWLGIDSVFDFPGHNQIDTVANVVVSYGGVCSGSGNCPT